MSAIMHRRRSAQLDTCTGAAGYRVQTAAGRVFVDATGSVGACSVGYQDERVLRAMTRQAHELSFVHNSLFTTHAAEELAAWLLAHAPAGFRKVLFSGGGSEAIEAACKLARQYFFEQGLPHKQLIVSRRLSYHGATLGALSLSGFEWRREPYEPVLGPSFLADPCYPYRCQKVGESDAEYAARAARSVEEVIVRCGAEKVCAVIVEPVVGAAGGAITPAPGYLARLRSLCDHYNVLLIFDEIMCGLGRTGHLHAGAAEGVAPDLQVIGKGLASGYQPLSAVLVQGSVDSVFADRRADLRHGFTFMAHPVACAAALQVQQIIDQEQLTLNAARTGLVLRRAIEDEVADLPLVGNVRGRGLMLGVELVCDRQSKRPLPRHIAAERRVRELCYDEGLLVYPNAGAPDGTVADTILLTPPLILDESGACEIAEKFGKALRRLVDDVARADL